MEMCILNLWEESNGMQGQVHKGKYSLAVLAIALIATSSAHAAVDDPAIIFFEKADFDKYGDYSYTIPKVSYVRVTIEDGLVTTETYCTLTKKKPHNEVEKIPLPPSLLEQVLQENKGDSEWEEPQQIESSNEDAKQLIRNRKDGRVSITTEEVEGNLMGIEVCVNKVKEAFEPIILQAPQMVTLQDIEWFVKLIKPHQASIATKVLSVEVKKDYIIQSELRYIRSVKKRWQFAATEANRLLQIEGLPSYIKEWLGWVIKGAKATPKAELAEFHIAAATLDEGLLSMRKMAQP